MAIDERYFYGAHGLDIEKAKQERIIVRCKGCKSVTPISKIQYINREHVIKLLQSQKGIQTNINLILDRCIKNISILPTITLETEKGPEHEK